MKILSFREQKLEGNILILVILVMLTVAMMGLLTMSFLKQMFTYTINLDGYYKSYYLSKAGIELALTEIDNSGIGFSNVISGDNNIFTKNLCNGGNCSVDLTISGRAKNLNNYFWEGGGCTTGNAFTLAGGESFALPLFLQNTGISNAEIVLGNGDSYSIANDIRNALNMTNPDDDNTRKLTLSLVFPDLINQLNYLYIATKDFNDSIVNSFVTEAVGTETSSLHGDLYLMISNPENTPVSFCFSSLVDLPATKFYVVSLGNYQGKYVGMQAIYAQPIPSFMFDGYHGAAGNLGGAVESSLDY